MIDSGKGKSAFRQSFVCRLRARAETATELSVHHARLAERYLLLSQKLTALAENASETVPGESCPSAYELEQVALSAHDIGEVEDPGLMTRAVTPGELGAQPSGRDVPAERTPSRPGLTELAGTNALQTTMQPRGKRSFVASGIRQQVERFRAVRNAGARRVKVKATTNGRASRTRTVTDEIRQSRGPLATSILLLGVAVLVLSLITWQQEIEAPVASIDCTFSSKSEPVEDAKLIETVVEESGEQLDHELADLVEVLEDVRKTEPQNVDTRDSEPETIDALTELTPQQPAALSAVADRHQMSDAKSETSDIRSEAGRRTMLKKFGGSAGSEAAVQRALDWLVSVQHPQGYWDFTSVGMSGNAGSVHNPIGGTAYALLPFLAAGQTHERGAYQKQIRAGLMYLTRIGVNAPAGYDLRGMVNKQSKDKSPNEAYYVQGAAALALCEAYAMTKDRWLRRPAQDAIQFIINSQDPNGGGWRYNPRERGSTSVTVVQVMALQAGRKAGLAVPQSVLSAVHRYLDAVQVDGVGRYGYEIDRKRYTGAVTAMALLCRMYLGWGRDDGDLRAGIALLDRAGPYDNLYSLYFGTQVMKNWGGEEWNRWNGRMRDDLVATQEKEGAGRGSWTPRSGAIHARQGGRLLTTALATLTLQVYYRYGSLLPDPTAPKENL